MAITHLHNFPKRSIHFADVYTPPGTFDHEVDGKLVEGSSRNMARGNRSTLFPPQTCREDILHMPRKSETRLHNNARSKDVFYGKQITHTIHAHCAHRFAKLVPVYKRGKPHLFIGFICTCEMRLSYWFYYDYLFQVQNFYTNVLPL
jgi:hypothetical protein